MHISEVDSIYDLNQKQKHFDFELFNNINAIIKDQYINLDNLGVNLLFDNEYEIEENILSPILNELLDYTHEFITPIFEFNYDLELGRMIYEFTCVDCYNTIIPAFLENINVYSYESFELYFKKKLKSNNNYFKANFVKSIQNILINIKKLEAFDDKIKDDENYKKLIDRYDYYVNLMNFGNTSGFLENYFLPILSKNEYDLISKIS